MRLAFLRPENWKPHAGKLALWIGGLLVAGLIGAGINSYLERPKLGVEVVSIGVRRVNPAAESDQKKVAASAEIITRADASSWAPRLESQTTLRAYLSSLENGHRDIMEAADRMALLRDAMRSWPLQLGSEESLNRVMDILWSNDVILNEFLIRRGTASEPIFRSSVEYSRNPIYKVEQDSDGQYFVTAGRKRLQLVCHDQHQHTRLDCANFSPIARRTANALAFGLAPDLEDLRRSLYEMLTEETTLRELLALMERELDAYSYWHVRAVITNSGKHPVSVSPQAIFYLNTADRKYRDVNGTEQEIESDSRIVLQALHSEPAKGNTPLLVTSDDPIVIDGGKAVAVTFRSISRVRDLKDRDAYAELYRSGSVNGKLAVMPITSYAVQVRTATPVQSQPVAFAEFTPSRKFPKNVW